MKFFIKGFFIKFDQIRSFLRIWSHLPKKSLMENLIFCAVIHNALNVLCKFSLRPASNDLFILDKKTSKKMQIIQVG